MELLFETIVEFVFGAAIEASQSNNIPKYIRYPLIVIVSLLFIAVIGIIFVAAIAALKDSILLGIFLILLGLFMLVRSIVMFRRAYLKRLP